MKKIILFVLFIGLFAIPVSAAETNDNNFVNVLDYNSFDSDGDNLIRIVSGDNNFAVSLPDQGYTRYVDLLFLTSGISDFTVKAGASTSNLSSLTIEQISANFYRVYGQVSFSRTSELNFLINSSASGYIEVLQFRYASERSNRFDIEAYCAINSHDYTGTIHYVPTDVINYRSWTSTADVLNSFYQATVYIEDWRKYDYIDVQMMFDVASINSISGTLGTDNIDLDVSYVGGTQWDSNYYFVTIGIDCTQFYRLSEDDIEVNIWGNVKFEEGNSIHFMKCAGIVYRNEIDSITFWFSSLNATIDANFSQLRTWIQAQTTAIVNAINGDTSVGEQFQEEVSERDEELQNMAAIMESVPKPDLNDINFTPEVDYNAILPLTFQLNNLMSNSIFSSVFLFAFILAIASYILYGKR